MKCSKLNAHLCALHVANTSTCLCGQYIENSIHYLSHWPIDFVSRQHMWQTLLNVVDVHEVNVDTLLYGIENGDFKMHSDIFEATHQVYKIVTNYNHHFQIHWVSNAAYWPMNLYCLCLHSMIVCCTTNKGVNALVNNNCYTFLHHCICMFGKGYIAI